MFSGKHIILLIASVAVISALFFLMRKKDLGQWYRLLIGVGIASESVKVVSYILMNEATFGGYLPKTDLPFQLCSLQLVFIAILYYSKNEKLKRLLMSFMLPTCLVGGMAAILIPTSSSLSQPAITVQYFGYHAVIVSFALYLLFSGKIQWTVKDYGNCLKMLAFVGIIAIYLNSLAYDVVEVVKDTEGAIQSVEYYSRVNFMYVVDPPVSGLPFLNKDHGWLVYLVHYAFLAVAAVTLCYLKPLCRGVKSRSLNRKAKKTCSEADPGQ